MADSESPRTARAARAHTRAARARAREERIARGPQLDAAVRRAILEIRTTYDPIGKNPETLRKAIKDKILRVKYEISDAKLKIRQGQYQDNEELMNEGYDDLRISKAVLRELQSILYDKLPEEYNGPSITNTIAAAFDKTCYALWWLLK